MEKKIGADRPYKTLMSCGLAVVFLSVTSYSVSSDSGAQNSCATYIVKSGDTLSSIAREFLGKSSLFDDILTLNASKGISAKNLQIGTVIDIPCVQNTTGANAPDAEVTDEVTDFVELEQNDISTNQVTIVALEDIAAPNTPKEDVVVKSDVSIKSDIIVEPDIIIAPEPYIYNPPTWTAHAGEYLSDIIQRWGSEAGYVVFTGGDLEWRLEVPVNITGEFEQALEQLVRGFGTSRTPPVVRVYANKVIRIGNS